MTDDLEGLRGIEIGKLEELRNAYRQIPPLVLADLQLFIRPEELSFVVDDPAGRASAYNEGMRSVWIHIEKRRAQLGELIATLKENDRERTQPAGLDPRERTAGRPVADAAQPGEYDPLQYTPVSD